MVANDDLSNLGLKMDNYERDFAVKALGKPSIYNVSFIGGGARGLDEADAPCLYFRRGAGGAYNNLLCYNWITRTVGRDNIADSIKPNITSGDFSANGLLSWNNGFNSSPAAPNTLDGQVTANFRTFFGAAARQLVIADPLLRRPLERIRPLTGSPVFRANWIPPPRRRLLRSMGHQDRRLRRFRLDRGMDQFRLGTGSPSVTSAG